KAAENAKVKKIESISRTGLSVIYIELVEGLPETGKEFDDIRLKLDDVSQSLPQGAGPVHFIKDFGDTEALMLTVASPKAEDIEISLRAKQIRTAIEAARPNRSGSRATVVACLPQSIDTQSIERLLQTLAHVMEEKGIGTDARPIRGSGFAGIDIATTLDDPALLKAANQMYAERVPAPQRHPDVWDLAVIRDPAEAQARIAAVAGDKYSYRDLEKYTELIQRTLQTVPVVSKVERSGILEERVFLDYSQERLASFGVQGSTAMQALGARNIMLPGGILE